MDFWHIFLKGKQDRYLIFQLKDIAENADIMFMNYDWMRDHDELIDRDNYRAVYMGGIKVQLGEASDADILEQLYEVFNREDRPKDFEGRSMSVSDVVVLKRLGVIKVYYVDSIGFKQIPTDEFFGEADDE